MAGGHRGIGAAVPPSTTQPDLGRHGSGARGSQPTGFGGIFGLTPPHSTSPRRRRDEDEAEEGGRDRERERDRSLTRSRAFGSARAPEVEGLVQRLNLIDNQIRVQSQQISVLETAHIKETKDREGLDQRMLDGGKNIAEQIQNMCNMYGHKIAELESTISEIVAGMHTVNAGVRQVQEEFKTRPPSQPSTVPVASQHQQAPASAHFIGTGNVGPSAVGAATDTETKTPSPWGQGNGSFCPQQSPGVQNLANNMQAAGNGQGYGPVNGAVAGNFNLGFGANYGAPGGNGHNGGYRGPGGGGGGPSGNPYGGPPGAGRPGGGGGGGGGPPPPPPGGGNVGQPANHNPRMGSTDNWHIDRKTPKNLVPWDGRWETYKVFRDMTQDHLVACNPLWAGLISIIEKERTQITMAKIQTAQLIPGVNMVHVTNELYAFMGTIIGPNVHKKRLRLAGVKRATASKCGVGTSTTTKGAAN